MYVPETKSKRDKHNFKYFKGGAIWILATGTILYKYASGTIMLYDEQFLRQFIKFHC
jgi:hypothetical protein